MSSVEWMYASSGQDPDPGDPAGIYGSKADLQLHTQVHMREAKPYKCAQCSKGFANSSYLSQHTRIHLGIKPYRCEICQRKFTQLSHLQQHIRTHTGDKPYKCRHPGCTKAFSQLSNLQSHSRCHQTDKPYKCNSCYKCFVDETGLLEHIPKHKESKHLKTHICQFCGKSYTQETYLAKHIQKHADRADKRAASLLGATPAAPSRQSAPDYWSKPPTGADVAPDGLSHHVRNHDSAVDACLQPSIQDHGTRLHMERSQGIQGDHSDLRHHGHPSQMPYEVSGVKTTSAFTPLQSHMIPISSGAPLTMPGSSRSYFPYDHLSFPKTPSQVASMEAKHHGGNSFPNQLISLHQIRSYATMPSMSSAGDHGLALKEKNQ